jgi:glycine cleavage system H protein
MAKFPTDLKYTKDHEWARREPGGVRIGITSFAVEQLGDVTLVDLPEKSTKLGAAAHFGDIESVKAVSELFAPVGGTVLETNAALSDHPELVNEAPYDKGWMVLLQVDDPTQLDALMDATAYETYLASLSH